MQVADLMASRRQKWQAAKDFLENHTGADGKIPAADVAIFEQLEGEILEMDRQIENAMRQPTTQPILNHPAANGYNSYLNGGKVPSRGVQREIGALDGGYHAEFLNALRTNFRQVTNTLQESVSADGGYLVPQEWDERIVTALAE